MQTVDLCQTDDAIHWNAFLTLLQEAQKPENNKLFRNYLNLEEKIKDHDSFHLILDDEEPIAFAGLYNNGIYDECIVRALNRAYVSMSARKRSGVMAFRTENDHDRRNYLTTRNILPLQVSIAKKNRDGIFISMETIQRRRAMKAMVNAMNRISNDHWKLLPHMYYTCPTGLDECRIKSSCWQNVALLSFRTFEFPLDWMTQKKWNRLFGEDEI